MNDVMQYNSTSMPAISLTNTARDRVIHCLNKEAGSVGLRLSVTKTGCSGLSYVMDYVKDFKVDDILVLLNDQYKVAIDKNSYPYLKGLTIDYIKQGLQYKFVFTNPNQTGQCGCGESFTV